MGIILNLLMLKRFLIISFSEISTEFGTLYTNIKIIYKNSYKLFLNFNFYSII